MEFMNWYLEKKKASRIKWWGSGKGIMKIIRTQGRNNYSKSYRETMY